MKQTKRKRVKKLIRGWRLARLLLEGWRKKLTSIQVELKQPRVIDVAPVDFNRGERIEPEGHPAQKFRGKLIFFTGVDVTIRRTSGAILVIDNFEIVALSDGKTRFEPAPPDPAKST